MNNADIIYMEKLCLLEQNSSDLLQNMVLTLPKYNLSWGTNYMLMDSQSFMGGTGVEEYEKIINMFCNIWDAYENNFA